MGASNSTQDVKKVDDADSFEIKPLYLLKKELILELGFDINPQISLLKRKNRRLGEPDTQIGHPHLLINADLYDRVRKPFKEGEVDPPFLSKRTMDPYNQYAHLENTDSDTQGSEDQFMSTKFNSKKRDQKLDKKDHCKKHHVGYGNYRNQSHFFKTFIEYRFMDSHRQNITDNNFWGHYRRDLRVQYSYEKRVRLRQMKQHDKVVKVPEIRPPDKAQVINPNQLKLLMKRKTRGATPKRSQTQDSMQSSLGPSDLRVAKQHTQYYNMGHIATGTQFENNRGFVAEKTIENTQQRQSNLQPDLGNGRGDLTSKKLVGIVNTGEQPRAAPRRPQTPQSLTESGQSFKKPVDRRKSQSVDIREPVALSKGLFEKIKKFFSKDDGDDQVRRPGPMRKPTVTSTTKNSKYKRKSDVNAHLRRRAQSVVNLRKVEEDQERLDESKKKKSILEGVAVKKGLATAVSPQKTDTAVKQQNRFERDPEEHEELYQKDARERNILVTTWIDDMKLPQQEMQRRNLFYMNESLLQKQSLNDHFDKSNVKLFYESGLEFICLKGSSANVYGKQNHFEPMIDENHRIARIKDLRAYHKQKNDRSMNQDSFFSVVDGNLKMIGVFDGHGEQGHLISCAASAHVLDYLRNRNDVFKAKNLPNATPEQIKHEIKCAFKYTQNVLREDFLISQDRQKLQKQKTSITKEKKRQAARMPDKGGKRKAVFKASARVDGVPEDKNSDIEILSNKYSNTSSQDDSYIMDLADKYQRAAEAINFQEFKKFDGDSEWEQEDKRNFWYQGSDYQSEISYESDQKSETRSGSKGRSHRDSKKSLKKFKLGNDMKNCEYGKRRYKMNLNFKINKRRLLKEVKRELISKACKKAESNTLGSNVNLKASASFSRLCSQDEIIKIPHERLRQSLEKRVLIEKLKKIRRVKREMDIMHKNHRTMQLNEKDCFKVVNKCPEVRYQVQRESQRQIARNKLMIQDKTKDQFLKFKRMKMLLQQQSRQFSQAHMNTISEKNSLFATPQPRQKQSSKSANSFDNASRLNTEQEHEGGSNLDASSHRTSRTGDRPGKRQSEQRLRQSVQETLVRIKESKNEHGINPFSVQIDVRDEEFEQNDNSNNQSKSISKQGNLSEEDPELVDAADLSSSNFGNTQIHISDEDEEGEQAQIERLQQGEINFGLKDQSDDSVQAEIEEQLLFEEDIIQKYKLLGSDSDPEFAASSEESESDDESSSSPSKSDCSRSEEEHSSPLTSEISSASNSPASKSKQTSSSLLKDSRQKSSKQSRSQSCAESLSRSESLAPDEPKIKLISQVASSSKVFERKQQKAKSQQAEAKLSRVKTTLELQYDKMELNKFKRTRQDQLQKVSKKKFSFKNEDKREQIKRIKDREFNRRVTGREKQEFNLDIAMSGTTATLVIIYDGIIYYGWVGDSLACLSKPMNACSQKNIQNNELILTLPYHTPMDQNEKMRIYRNKGEIRNEKPKEEKKIDDKESEQDELIKISKKMKGSNNDKDENGTKIEQLRKIEKQKKDFTTGHFDPFTCPRIYNRGRLYPGLQVSRSLGDFVGHRIGVTSEPGVGSYKFTKHNEYLVVASRSLWNEMSPKEVFEFISMHSHYEQMGTVPCLLADKVRDSCIQEALTPIQDITIVIHSLNANIAKFK